MFGQAHKGLSNHGLHHDVTVKNNTHLTPIGCDMVPVGQKGCATDIVLAFEVPHAQQGERDRAVTGQGIRLFLSLSDPEWPGGIGQERLTPGRAVQAYPGRLGDLILNGVPFFAKSWGIGPINYQGLCAVRAPEGQEQSGSVFRLGLGIAMLEEEVIPGAIIGDRAVPTLSDHLGGNAAPLAEHGEMVGGEILTSWASGENAMLYHHTTLPRLRASIRALASAIFAGGEPGSSPKATRYASCNCEGGFCAIACSWACWRRTRRSARVFVEIHWRKRPQWRHKVL